MALAVLETIRPATTALAFEANKEQLGLATEDSPARFNVGNLTDLNTGDSSEAVYARLYGGTGFEQSGSRQHSAERNNEDGEENEKSKSRKGADAMRSMQAAIEKPWYEQAWDSFKDANPITRTVAQAAENTWAFVKDPIGTLADGAQAVGKAGQEFTQDPLGTAGNIGNSALNMVTFGMLGTSREDIAARLEAEAQEREQAAAQPTQSRDERLAQSSAMDINAPGAAPALASPFSVATGETAPAAETPEQGQQLVASAPAARFNSTLGMG